MMRAAALTAPTAEAPVTLRTRADQLQAMLDRAAARGEKTPTIAEPLEGVTAPLYLHPLFFGRPADACDAKELIRRLLVYVDAEMLALIGPKVAELSWQRLPVRAPSGDEFRRASSLYPQI